MWGFTVSSSSDKNTNEVPYSNSTSHGKVVKVVNINRPCLGTNENTIEKTISRGKSEESMGVINTLSLINSENHFTKVNNLPQTCEYVEYVGIQPESTENIVPISKEMHFTEMNNIPQNTHEYVEVSGSIPHLEPTENSVEMSSVSHQTSQGNFKMVHNLLHSISDEMHLGEIRNAPQNNSTSYENIDRNVNTLVLDDRKNLRYEAYSEPVVKHVQISCGSQTSQEIIKSVSAEVTALSNQSKIIASKVPFSTSTENWHEKFNNKPRGIKREKVEISCESLRTSHERVQSVSQDKVNGSEVHCPTWQNPKPHMGFIVPQSNFDQKITNTISDSSNLISHEEINKNLKGIAISESQELAAKINSRNKSIKIITHQFINLNTASTSNARSHGENIKNINSSVQSISSNGNCKEDNCGASSEKIGEIGLKNLVTHDETKKISTFASSTAAMFIRLYFEERNIRFNEDFRKSFPGVLCLKGSTFTLTISRKQVCVSLICFLCSVIDYSRFTNQDRSNDIRFVFVNGRYYLICRFCRYLEKWDARKLFNDTIFFKQITYYCKWNCGIDVSVDKLYDHEKKCENQRFQECPIKSCTTQLKICDLDRHLKQIHPEFRPPFGYLVYTFYGGTIVKLKCSMSPVKQIFLQSNIPIFVEFIWESLAWKVNLSCKIPNVQLRAVILNNQFQLVALIKGSGMIPHFNQIHLKCYLADPNKNNFEDNMRYSEISPSSLQVC